MTKEERARQFLATPENWPLDENGRRRCCLKSVDSSSRNQFGVVFWNEPLRVYIRRLHNVTAVETEGYDTLEELLKVWTVD